MIQFLFSLFAFGAFGFWFLVALACVFFTVAVETERYLLSVLVAIGLLVLYHTQLALIPWQVWLIGFGCYGAVGGMYSIYKWTVYTNMVVQSWREEHRRDKKESNPSELLKYTLNVRLNKGRIIGWIVLWPWGLAWRLTGGFFNTIYDQLQALYMRIAIRAVAKLHHNLDDKMGS